MYYRCNPHHISNHMIVPFFGSVDSQDSKHEKNHGPGVNQRTNRWVATHTIAAWVKAKGFG